MKLLKYIIRWQASTPILWLCVQFMPWGNITKTILANLIGAILFFKVDELIFKNKGE